MPAGAPLRCKAQGGWGGSAHSPDPTAQSASQNAAAARARAGVLRGVPTRPRPPRRSRPRGASDTDTPDTLAPPTATLRVALAGRQILTRFARALRALTQLVTICRPAMARFALTSPRDIDFVGSLRPHGRNGAYRIRDEPKGPDRRPRVNPHLDSIALDAQSIVRPLQLSRCIARLHAVRAR